MAVWDGLGRASELDAAAELEREGIRVSRTSGHAVLDAIPAPRAVVKSPGLSFAAPVIAEACRRGLLVIDEAELGWRLDPRPLVAVTGTNGKSTATSLVAAVLVADGRRPVAAGNTRFGVPLSAAHREPGDVVVAELSSFQLEGCPALRPDAALLTNVTSDHVYRHGSFAAYVACKRRLFVGEGEPVAVAAIGIDQEPGRALARELSELGSAVVTFGRHPDADRRVLDVEPRLGGGRARISEGRRTRDLHLRLTGAHNALNAAAALALADALGIDPDVASRAVEETDPLPGRYERVPTTGDYEVVVDFAHNPDGVEQALDAGRAILAAAGGGGALRVVLSTLSLVGEPQARAVGRTARRGADHLVLTTQRWTLDDPPGALPPGLLEGATEEAAAGTLVVEPDRSAAIRHALRAAMPGDLVLILDRGEAAGTLYDPDDRPRPFDDRAEVHRLLAATGG